MNEEEVLELKTRRQIYNHILKHPGLHEREISRQSTIPLSTLDYHLFFLKKRGLVTNRSDERYTRYYIAGAIGIKDKRIIAILRQNVFRKVIIFLLLHPHSFHRDICNYLELAPSTISFHLNRLANLEVVNRIQVGRETKYYIEEVEYVSDLLITYQKSFFESKKERKEINLLSLF